MRGNIFGMGISDTTSEAAAIQLRIERAKTGEERLIEAFEMSLFMRELSAAGIRDAHPDWTEAQVRRELLRFAFLPDPLPPGL